jgi:RNA polymerase primary sigma factor
MDRTAAAKAKTNRKRGSNEPRRVRTARRVGNEPRRGGSRVVHRPANDIDIAVPAAPETPEGVEGVEGVIEESLAPTGELVEDALGPFEDPGLGEVEGVDVTAITSAPIGGAVDELSADPEDAEEEEVDQEEPEEQEAEQGGGTPVRAEGDEPQSFLAMYFRDMAELDVLRPEQEFETARKIEELELELWRTLLGFLPAAAWTSEQIEKTVGHPLPDLRSYRALAEKARKKPSIATRSKLEKMVSELAVKLKELDIDRVYVDAVMTEVHRVARAARGAPHLDALPSFASTKAFGSFARNVAEKSLRVKRAKNEFVKANLRLVVSIARRFNHGRLPLPDLIQEGNIGLMKAVERYDYRRGFRFSTYASWWIRHAISRALADKGRAVRLPVHMIDAYHKIAKSERELQSRLERPATMEEISHATGIEAEKLEKMKTFLAETPVSLDKPISDEDGRRLIDVLVDPNEAPTPPEQMMNTETQREMLKLLGGLKPIEADILRKRFGLVNDRERTLKEIGDEYHLSRERVRQLQEQALGKMRRAMAKLEIA